MCAHFLTHNDCPRIFLDQLECDFGCKFYIDCVFDERKRKLKGCQRQRTWAAMLHGTRCPRIRLEDEHILAADRKLDVEQAFDVEPFSEPPTLERGRKRGRARRPKL